MAAEQGQIVNDSFRFWEDLAVDFLEDQGLFRLLNQIGIVDQPLA